MALAAFTNHRRKIPIIFVKVTKVGSFQGFWKGESPFRKLVIESRHNGIAPVLVAHLLGFGAVETL